MPNPIFTIDTTITHECPVCGHTETSPSVHPEYCCTEMEILEE